MSDADNPGNSEDGGDGGGREPVRGLEEARRARSGGGPPVHLWTPPDHGPIDMVIRRDGTWEHEGTPITRPALVRLFASILRLEDNGVYYLVTPVEKVSIRVEDVPFLAVEVEVNGQGEDQALTFRTNVEDLILAGEGHLIRVEIDPETEEPSPYIHVRRRLEARIARPVFYELVELGCVHVIDGRPWFGVWSAGIFFPFTLAEDVGKA